MEQHDDDQRQITGLKTAVDTANQNQQSNTKQFVDAFAKLSRRLNELETQVHTEDLQKKLAVVQDDLRGMETGGDSFAFITFTAEAPGPSVRFSNFAAPSGTPYFLVAATSQGYPLRDAHATMTTSADWLPCKNTTSILTGIRYK